MPAGVEVWDKATSWGRKVGRRWFTGSIGEVGRDEGNLQLLGRRLGLSLVEQRERRSSIHGLWFTGGCLLELWESEGMEVRRGWSVASTGDAGSGEGILQLMFSCSTRDKSGGLHV